MAVRSSLVAILWDGELAMFFSPEVYISTKVQKFFAFFFPLVTPKLIFLLVGINLCQSLYFSVNFRQLA